MTLLPRYAIGGQELPYFRKWMEDNVSLDINQTSFSQVYEYPMARITCQCILHVHMFQLAYLALIVHVSESDNCQWRIHWISYYRNS